MKDTIKQLAAVQDQDLELDRLRVEAAAIPGKVKAVQSEIESAKSALEAAKKELVHLQMARKQKELDLETQEGAIRKHSTELNAVKTNEAYKALLGEIDKAKSERSVLEDQILQIMEQTDLAQKTWKEKETHSKSQEGGLRQQIVDWETKQKELEQTISEKQTQRDGAFAALEKKLADVYDRLRKNRRGPAMVPIRNEQCTGCHMKVSQNLINEVRRGQKLMTCESCSRIVFLEDSLVAKAADH